MVSLPDAGLHGESPCIDKLDAAVILDDRSAGDADKFISRFARNGDSVPVLVVMKQFLPERVHTLQVRPSVSCLPFSSLDDGSFLLLSHLQHLLEIKRLTEEKHELSRTVKRQEGSFKKIVRRETKELYRTYKKLKAMDRLKMDLITLISHQIRTPLCTILGQADLLLDGLYDDEQEFKEMVNGVQNQGRRIAQFVNDATTFLSWRLGRASFECSEFALSGVIAQALAGMEGEIQKKKLTIQSDVQESLRVYSDFNHIVEVVNRVLDNAVNYSPEGGMVVLRSADINEQTILEIKDEGRGVDPVMLEKLYNPLEVAEDIKYHVDGNGMSLAICSEILQALGAGFTIQSEGLNKGCLVMLALPQTKEACESA